MVGEALIPEVRFGRKPHSPRSLLPLLPKDAPETNAPPATQRRHDAARDEGTPPSQVIHNRTPADIRRRARTPAYAKDGAAAVVVHWIQ